MRVSKSNREKNARQFYRTLIDGCSNKAAIVVQRSNSTTNPNINRVQFVAVSSWLAYSEPVVIAESETHGIEGCFIELIRFIMGGIIQKTYYEDGFNEWLKETCGFKITYTDGFVFMLERESN